MIQIQLSLPPGHRPEDLPARAAALLSVREEELLSFRILRRSIDARKKPKVFYAYTVECTAADEEALVRRANVRAVTLAPKRPAYRFPQPDGGVKDRPVIVGLGPAGLFAALFLARAGVPCLILERGRDVDRRSADVERFWQTGVLDENSNVQFGEGGAGTFSDGKLTTGTHDPRIRAVLETLSAFGAPEEITYVHKPHVGTDRLREVVKAMRQELLSLGCELRFGHQLVDLHIEGGALRAIEVSDEEGTRRTLPCSRLILAPGHSARDTFHMLAARGLVMAQKPFAIGLRIEHRQAEINRAQFGPSASLLPPSDYKLSCHLPNGRSVFSFCVCPGGEVVAAASEEGLLVTNGMSREAREGDNCNGALLVGVGPQDFSGEDALAGLRFQAKWERAAWELGGRKFRAPAQLVGDFLRQRPSNAAGDIRPSYRPGVSWCDLRACLPDYVSRAIGEALPVFERKIKGFACPESVLTGVETRSSSPLRILRDRESLESSVRGLYPCGEGAGYAGGIVSAAVDGIRVAEALCR